MVVVPVTTSEICLYRRGKNSTNVRAVLLVVVVFPRLTLPVLCPCLLTVVIPGAARDLIYYWCGLHVGLTDLMLGWINYFNRECFPTIDHALSPSQKQELFVQFLSGRRLIMDGVLQSDACDVVKNDDNWMPRALQDAARQMLLADGVDRDTLVVSPEWCAVNTEAVQELATRGAFVPVPSPNGSGSGGTERWKIANPLLYLALQHSCFDIPPAPSTQSLVITVIQSLSHDALYKLLSQQQQSGSALSSTCRAELQSLILPQLIRHFNAKLFSHDPLVPPPPLPKAVITSQGDSGVIELNGTGVDATRKWRIKFLVSASANERAVCLCITCRLCRPLLMTPRAAYICMCDV